MSETINATIQELQGQLRALDDEAAQLKQTINLLCKRTGREPIYGDISKGGTLSDIQGDTYYGQPLNSAVRDYLERRKAAGLGPASVRDIFDGLTQGGFQFNAKSEDNAQRSLRITLSKSTHTFHKLPNGSYGLLAWYPTVKPAKEDEVEEDDDPLKDLRAAVRGAAEYVEVADSDDVDSDQHEEKQKGGDHAKKGSQSSR
jgi:hypothetical protein